MTTQTHIALMRRLLAPGLALVLASHGFVTSLSATPLTMPGQLSSVTADWFFSNNTGAFGAEPGGLGVTEAEFTNPAQGLDAYDSAWMLRLGGANGSYFASPGAVDATYSSGPLAASALFMFGSIEVQIQYCMPDNQQLIRSTFSFRNTTGSTQSLSLRIESNLGSDATTAIAQRQANNATTRWLVTTDGGSGGDLVNTLARYGAGATVTPTANSVLPGTSISNRTDILADEYQLTIPGSETWRLVTFGRLDSVETSLTDGILSGLNYATNKFDNTTLMQSLGLFAGITSDFSEIKNWVVPVPEPGPRMLGVTGLAVWVATRVTGRRRKKSAAFH